MPRTKTYRKRQNNIKKVESKLENFKKIIQQGKDDQLAMFDQECIRKTVTIPSRIANITIGEFDQRNGFSSICTKTYTQQMFSHSRVLKENSRFLLLRRSNSFDEGYLTAGSSKNTTAAGERQSRLKSRQTRQRRLSKSSSPSQLPSSSTSTLSSNTSSFRKYRTPKLQPPPNTYGLITPKVNPNTPQVLLRRPKCGEMVLSLQGSPLYTGAVIAEEQANINIPLEDGKLLTLQPQRGLRLSQIPELHPSVRSQLEMLRDNLNKVCAVNAKR